jgi:hypothetical protein
VLSWVIIKLMDRNDNSGWDYGLMLAVWAAPFLTVPLGIAGLPVSFLPMLTLGARLLWRIAKSQDARQSRLHEMATPQFGAVLLTQPRA